MKPSFFVTVDPKRGLALVKGKAGIKSMFAVLGVPCHGWSPSKRGFVIDAASVPDVEAYANSCGGYAVVHGRDDAADLAALAAAEKVFRDAGMLP